MIMQRKITLFIAALMTLALSARNTADTLGVHPYKPVEQYTSDRSHWSLYFPIGATVADMDESNGAKLNNGGLNMLTINGAIGVEYNFTPTWGLAAEFSIANYGSGSFTARKDDDGFRKDKDGNPASLGMIYNMELLLTYDFADALFPHRKNTLFNLYGLLGGGVGCYQYQSRYDDSWSSATAVAKHKDWMKYDRSPFLDFGLLADFNITREFGLGARLTYKYYLSDNLDYSANKGAAGYTNSLNQFGDGLIFADVVLRYKFQGDPKSHVRNMTNDQYDNSFARNNKPARDTTVIIHKDTVVCKEIVKENGGAAAAGSFQGKSFYVYFDNAKPDLREDAINTLQQVSDILMDHDEYYVDVIGYCDNTGSVDFNRQLAVNRANNVVQELQREYGIPADHFLSSGRGKLVGTHSTGSYSANRRVEIRIISKEEFESRKEERDEATKKNTYAYEGIRDRSSVNAVSLTNIARLNYGNPNCWVYIYEANMDRIPDINKIGGGLALTIPMLNDEQRKITKEEAKAYYQKLQEQK